MVNYPGVFGRCFLLVFPDFSEREIPIGFVTLLVKKSQVGAAFLNMNLIQIPIIK